MPTINWKGFGIPTILFEFHTKNPVMTICEYSHLKYMFMPQA